MVKSVSRKAGPSEFIRDMHAIRLTIPSVVAISGTPISTGPADILGPLVCFTGRHAPQTDQEDDMNDPQRLDEKTLLAIDKRFRYLLNNDSDGTTMTELI